MIERLHYDFDEKKNLTLDVPRSIFEETMNESRLGEIFDRSEHLVIHENVDDADRLTFDSRRFKKLMKDAAGDIAHSDAYASQWLYALNVIKRNMPEAMEDESLDVAMSMGPLEDMSGQQRRGMSAKLAWPLLFYSDAQAAATEAMRRSALTFGYVQPSIIDEVYANVDHQHGVELQALQVGCCCLTTSGEDYAHRSDLSESIELTGHNLYNRQLVLTCLTGLVTIARQRDGFAIDLTSV